MKSALAPTGTTSLLTTLSPLVPDEFINDLLKPNRHPGRRHFLSAAQLWRVHLLALLTPVHSFNGLVRLLPEQRSWRVFAHLHHRDRTPDVRMLNEFRTRAGVAGLRRINDELLRPLLNVAATNSYSVAIIDATDLPAATADQKKRRHSPLVGATSQLGSSLIKARAHSLFCGLQKAHLAFVDTGL